MRKVARWLVARLTVRAMLSASAFGAGLSGGMGWQSFLHGVTLYVHYGVWLAAALVCVGVFIYSLTVMIDQMASDTRAVINWIRSGKVKIYLKSITDFATELAWVAYDLAYGIVDESKLKTLEAQWTR